MLRKQPKKAQSVKRQLYGFTIIEILIVLVLVGLILLVVFLAVPAFQRNERNARRDKDAGLIASAIAECMLYNNKNVLRCDTPAEIGIDNSELSIFSGIHYGADGPANSGGASVPPTIDEPNWLFALTCNATLTWFGPPDTSGRLFVVTYYRENASGYTSRCIQG